MTAELFTPEELTDFVDTLAALKAEAADLKTREDTYKAALIASGLPAINGTLHRVTVSSTYRAATDWKAIAEALNAPADLIAKHTTTADEPTYTVRVTARKAGQ